MLHHLGIHHIVTSRDGQTVEMSWHHGVSQL